MKHLQWKNLLLVAYFLSMKGGIQKFSKLIEKKLFGINEKQIDNHTLMLDMLHHTCQLYVLTIEVVSLKGFIWCGCGSLLIYVPKVNQSPFTKRGTD